MDCQTNDDILHKFNMYETTTYKQKADGEIVKVKYDPKNVEAAI